MPTTEELRAAAERLAKDLPDHDCKHLWNCHRQCQWCHQMQSDVDAALLASHYLSTPPAPTDERLAEIEAAANAATPGPWEARDVVGAGLQLHAPLALHEGLELPFPHPPEKPMWFIGPTSPQVVQVACERWVQFAPTGWDKMQRDNFAFIALARTAVPELLAAIRDQQRQLVESRAEVERLQRMSREITCVWCGHQFVTTLQSQAEELYQHAKTCEKHPVRKAESERDAAIADVERLKSEVWERRPAGCSLAGYDAQPGFPGGHRCDTCHSTGTEERPGWVKRADRLQREVERLQRALAYERQSQMQFVPDEHGGHLLNTSTGDKWYPESFIAQQVDAARKELNRA